MYAVWGSYQKTGYGQYGTADYVRATFDTEEDAKKWVEREKENEHRKTSHRGDYSIRKADWPHNPPLKPLYNWEAEQKKRRKQQYEELKKEFGE